MKIMKDSGIEWIGQIPKDWSVKKIKHWADLATQNSFVDGDWIESPDVSDCGIRYLTTGNIGDGIFKRQGNGYITIDTFYRLNCKYAYPKDLVISRLNAPYGRSCILPNDFPEYVLAVDNVILRSKESSRYICYVTQCDGYHKAVEDDAKGTTMKRISRTNLGNIFIPHPHFSEQQKIADYLDKVCGEADEMIALQEKMIEELKAYKQSIITEAVTKGLNPNVPMKDSGIDWIGEIPEHWRMNRFYKTNWIRARLGWKGLKAEEYTETGYPFLSAFNIINDKLDWSDLNYINKDRFDESPEIKLSIGDLLLVKDGAGIGKCAVVDSLPEGESTVNSSLAVVTPTDTGISSKYQYYYFKSSIFQNTIWLLKIGMGVPHLTQENMRDISIPCPPIFEQRHIASFLDIKCSDIDSLIAIKQQKIEELKEYKKSVIYEYVTGKKEVI